jgi:predicted 2-oxoglutarate/Fe(II)-dependent dioxygenase YbiX
MCILLLLTILLPAQAFLSIKQCTRPQSISIPTLQISIEHTDQDLSYDNGPDPVVFAHNVQAHMELVRQSEGTFYGFYPDGFKEFDTDNAPTLWMSYALEDNDTELQKIKVSQSFNIWDSFTQFDEEIIPPPFTARDLARVSKTPILSSQECQEIIDECENHYWGWSSSSERYGTASHRVGHMLKLEALSRSYTLVNFELLPRLFPAIIAAFPNLNTNAANLRLGGCRVVKYDASEGRVELGLHRDGLLLTANMALNDLNAYEGGGTYVEGIPDFMSNPIKLQKGHCLLHPGDVKHGGAAITKGVRYVLVCFILDTKIIPHQKYCHDRMRKALDAARLIPGNDESRSKEKSDLLASASKHCADAYAFENL